MVAPGRRHSALAVLPALSLLCVSCSGSNHQATAPLTAPASTTTTTTTLAPTQPPSRCSLDNLSVRLGTKSAVPGATGQYRVALVFANTGSQSCTMHGFPAVTLHGPNDPNGPDYQLPQAPAGATTVQLAVGGAATATITYLKWESGDVGSLGSTNWTPTTVIVTPPGAPGHLTAAWTPGDPVLRQDEASHPGSYVGPVKSQ